MSEWQPIETAPKDGRKFLVLLSGLPYLAQSDRVPSRMGNRLSFMADSLVDVCPVSAAFDEANSTGCYAVFTRD